MMYINHPLLILIICFIPTFPVQAQSISSEVGSASEEIAVRSIPNNRALTLTDCLRQALHHPRIEAAAKDVSVQEALEIQSGVLPNPVLEGEFENVLGTGELQAFDGIEATLAVSQLFERAANGNGGYRWHNGKPGRQPGNISRLFRMFCLMWQSHISTCRQHRNRFD